MKDDFFSFSMSLSYPRLVFPTLDINDDYFKIILFKLIYLFLSFVFVVCFFSLMSCSKSVKIKVIDTVYDNEWTKYNNLGHLFITVWCL